MTSSQFKPERDRGADLKPHRSIVALPKSITDPIAKRSARLNQHDQSRVYREHCEALRKARPKKKAKTPADPVAFVSPQTKSRALRAERRAARLARSRALRK